MFTCRHAASRSGLRSAGFPARCQYSNTRARPSPRSIASKMVSDICAGSRAWNRHPNWEVPLDGRDAIPPPQDVAKGSPRRKQKTERATPGLQFRTRNEHAWHCWRPFSFLLYAASSLSFSQPAMRNWSQGSAGSFIERSCNCTRGCAWPRRTPLGLSVCGSLSLPCPSYPQGPNTKQRVFTYP